ncbi:MAG: hypothetical protein AB7T06_06990 [Kofleriaceae bacterium]
MLLPVRLETRWFVVDGSTDLLELRVRVFPDEIHFAEEMPATTAELHDVGEYWVIRARDGEDAEATQIAWLQLADRFGIGRAAWLVRANAPGATPEATATRMVAVGLPDRWRAILRGPNVHIVETGNPISEIVGAPVAGDAPGPSHQPALGAALAWIVDFGDAEAVGMALRLRVPRAAAAQLESLTVIGVRPAAPDTSATELGALIARHARHRDAALLGAGSPTNFLDAMPELPTDSIGDAGGASNDVARFASALGIDAEALRDLTADRRDRNAIAKAMNTVVWAATWDYFFEALMPRPANVVTAGRELFIEHVRPAGGLPLLRIKAQPYGVLAATSLERWPATAPFAQMAQILEKLGNRWAPFVHVPRTVDSTDVDKDLLSVLRRAPFSLGGWVRGGLDRDSATVHVGGIVGSLIEAAEAVNEALAAAARAMELAALGVTGPAPVLDLVFDDDAKRLTISMVASASNPRDQVLQANYLRALVDASSDDLANDRIQGADPRTLLYVLARHATTRMRLKVADQTLGTLEVLDRVNARTRLDGGLVTQPTVATTGARPATTPSTAARTAAASAATTAASPTTVAPPTATPPPKPPIWTRLASVRLDTILQNPLAAAHHAALSVLADAPVGELEVAFAGALDACSHRLDAWATALASRRLSEMRTQQARKSYLGAWGWLERPRPRADLTGTQGEGFLHTPSPTQASTAAVLRAAYEAHRVDDQGPSLEIDLSSDRVRRARRLLDGVRQGNSLAILVGEQIEDWLAREPSRIDVVRGQYGLARGTVVVDGWRVLRDWQDHAPSHPVDAAAATRLIEWIDAVADLMFADSAHHAVMGSTARIAAALDTLERGEIAVPDPMVDRSTSDGPRVRRRILLALDDRATWVTTTPSPRASASPRLEGWVASVLGDPAGVVFEVELEIDGQLQTETRSLAGIGVGALDVVALVGAGDDAPLRALVASTTSGVVRSVHSAQLPDLMLRAGAVYRLLSTARSPVANDLSAPLPAAPDRRAAVLAELAAAADRPIAAAALVGAQLVANPSALAAALAELVGRASASGGDPVREVLGDHTALPLPMSALPSLAPADPIEIASWLGDLARVRTALEPLDLLALLVPDLVGGRRARTSDGVDLVVFGASEHPRELLVLDAWTETAPAEQIDTGVAFRHDAPRSQPPQAILVAVPPPSTAWSVSLVESIIDETMQLVRLRAIAPSEVHDHVLPAIYVAEDPDSLTATTDFTAHVEAVVMEAMQ